MFAFCVTEGASGSCPGVSFSWFWTQELTSVSSLAYVLLVKCPMKPGRCSCALRDWAHRSRPLGTCVCSGAELKPKWLNPCLAMCPKTSQGPLWSLLLTVLINSEFPNHWKQGKEERASTDDLWENNFLQYIYIYMYIYIYVCVYIYIYI